MSDLMTNAGHYGPLIGAIDEGTSSARFLVSFPHFEKLFYQERLKSTL